MFLSRKANDFQISSKSMSIRFNYSCLVMAKIFILYKLQMKKEILNEIIQIKSYIWSSKLSHIFGVAHEYQNNW